MTILDRADRLEYLPFDPETAHFFEVSVRHQPRLTIGVPKGLEDPCEGVLGTYEVLREERPFLRLPEINGMLPIFVEVDYLSIPENDATRKLSIAWPKIRLPHFSTAVRIELQPHGSDIQLTPAPQVGKRPANQQTQHALFDEQEFGRWPLRK